MSITTSTPVLSGISTVLTPPRPGIYYTSVAIYNYTGVAFTVELGSNQHTLAPSSADIFAIPTSGGSPQLAAANGVTGYNTPVPYAEQFGSVDCVWFDPTDVVGSYPISLSSASNTTTYTEQLFLEGPLTVVPGATLSVPISSAWRALWAVTNAAGAPTVIGTQSGLTYNAFTPPYLTTPGVFYRFPLIAGIDTSLELTWNHTGSAWVGADLAPIDTVIFNSSGGP